MIIRNEVYDTWLQYYRNIHKKGRYVNECVRNQVFGDAPEQYDAINDELDRIISACGKFLDRNHLHMKPTKWQYRKDDPTTWMSHEDFAYGYLL